MSVPKFYPSVTVAEKVTELLTWPDRTAAIRQASVSAAESYGDGDRPQATYWTEVGLLLNAASDREPGASLTELADTLKVSV